MILSEPQKVISADSTRFRVCCAGRRFGKTFLAINELAKFSRFPGRRVLFIANTYRQAKQTCWDELKTQLYQRNWIQKVNESDLCIILRNNSRIYLRSADNKDALRGAKYDFIVMDECADIDAETWFSVLRPTLSDTGGHALFIGTPKGRNWFYDLFVQAGAQQDWSSHNYTTIQGGFVPQEEIDAAKRDLDERTYLQEYEANFVDYSGVVFYAFSEHNMRKAPELSPSNAIHIGLDFNVDPMSAVVCLQQGDHLMVIDEIEIYGSNTHEMVLEIQRKFGINRQIFVYPDASGAKRSTTSPGLSDHIILKNSGFIVRSASSNPPISESIASVNSRLRTSSGDIKLWIDPQCKKLRECLIKHTYKEGTRVPTKDQGYDHMTDALRYVVHMLYPLRPNIVSKGVHAPRSIGRMR